jgi:predicted Zn-dependent protease with MMP-like domain
MFDVPLDRFEDLVATALGEMAGALGELPGEVDARLEHLVVVISDAPSGAFSGLHEALPVGARRVHGTAAVAPDRITVHRRSLVDGCRTEAEVAARIRSTLHAELTRVLELPDAEVRALGW